jgi:hypothetical protein
MCILMALCSSEQACVITVFKLAPQTHKVPVHCVCVNVTVAVNNNVHYRRAPSLNKNGSISCTMNVNLLKEETQSGLYK